MCQGMYPFFNILKFIELHVLRVLLLAEVLLSPFGFTFLISNFVDKGFSLPYFGKFGLRIDLFCLLFKVLALSFTDFYIFITVNLISALLFILFLRICFVFALFLFF